MPPHRLDRIVILLAVLLVLLHVLVNATSPYGVHRDEFLYMAMGRHLRLWRMDFPPFIAIVAQLSRLCGDSLVAIRIVPALAAGALVLLAGLTAASLGGGRRAQALAAVAVVANPLFLRAGNLLQPVVLDQLWWTLGYYALVRVVRARAASADSSDERRWWLILGIATGVGLLTKFSIGFFAVGVLAGVLAPPLRRALLTPWAWLAVLVALAIGSPSITGQIALHFPVRSQMQELQSSQLQRVTPGSFLAGQLLLGPTVLLAIVGWMALVAGALRPWRAIGIATLATFGLLLVLHGKPYYVGPIYPALVGAGATALELASAGTPGRVRHRGTIRVVAFTLVVGFALVTLPFGLPILPPPAMARYAASMGVKAAVTTNGGQVAALPQDYADMLGWKAQTDAVVRVYRGLTPAERALTVNMAGNYGEAGALDFYGAREGLPPTVSPAGSYWFFGPGPLPGQIVLFLGNRDARAELARDFSSVAVVASVAAPERAWLVAEEQNVVVFRCDGPRVSLQHIWPSLADRN